MTNQVAPQPERELSSTPREQLLDHWLSGVLESSDYQRLPLAGDASFRRYYRILHKGGSFAVMDAPPPETPKLFVEVALALEKHGLTVPRILSQELTHGFLLLSDFGDRVYLNELNATTAAALYQDAFQALLQVQTCPAPGFLGIAA